MKTGQKKRNDRQIKRRRPRMATRCRIALLVGGSVMLALLAMLLIFNIGTRNMMESRARSAIEAAMQDGDASASENGYYAEVFRVPQNISAQEERHWFTDTERNLIDWYQSHDVAENEVQRVQIGAKMYYLAVFQESWGGMDGEEDDDGDDGSQDDRGAAITLIAYVDVTDEPKMIARLSLYMLIVTAIVGVCGSAVGYLTGKRLEENEASKQHFFENTSHELKTPLAVIRGYAEGIGSGVITDYRRVGRVISAQTEKMSSLVEDILLISKLEGGSEPLHRRTVEMKDLVQDCLMPLEGLVGKHGLEVEMDLRDVNISADPDRMEHAITNLLTNSIKYAKTKIRVTLDEGQLRIWNDCEDLSADDVAHMFERFYTGTRGNTGIGLALAKEIIDQHGFSIRAARSEDGLMIKVAFS